MKKNTYSIFSKSQCFTPKGLSPDRSVSEHKTLKQAQKAFDKVIGRAVLMSPDGHVLDSKII